MKPMEASDDVLNEDPVPPSLRLPTWAFGLSRTAEPDRR